MVDSSQDAHHRWLRIARELAAMEDAVARLLTWHARTDEGLCRCCTRPGRGTPMLPWPCPVWTLARLAQTLHASRHGPDAPPTEHEPGTG